MYKYFVSLAEVNRDYGLQYGCSCGDVDCGLTYLEEGKGSPDFYSGLTEVEVHIGYYCSRSDRDLFQYNTINFYRLLLMGEKRRLFFLRAMDYGMRGHNSGFNTV